MSVWNEFYLEAKDEKGKWICLDPGYLFNEKFHPQPFYVGCSPTSFIVNDYTDETIEFEELSEGLKAVKKAPADNATFISRDYFLPKIINTSLDGLIHDSKQKYDSSGIVKKLDYENFINGYADYLCAIDSDDLKDISELEKKNYQYAEWVDPDSYLSVLHNLIENAHYTINYYNEFANKDISLNDCRIVCFVY